MAPVLGGKGEGAAGIFEAWDVNHDGEITVQEVCDDLREGWLSGLLGFTLDLMNLVKNAKLHCHLAFPNSLAVGHTYDFAVFFEWGVGVW